MDVEVEDAASVAVASAAVDALAAGSGDALAVAVCDVAPLDEQAASERAHSNATAVARKEASRNGVLRESRRARGLRSLQ
jgi:hypothetical protein